MKASEVVKAPCCGPLVFVMLVLLACGGGSDSGPSNALTVGGDGDALQALEALAKAYGEEQGERDFSFVPGGDSASGVEATTGGEFDLAALSRPLKATESASGLQYLPFARDRVLIIVSPNVLIPDLSSQQVREIFLGLVAAQNLENWSSVGGPDATINLKIRDEVASATNGVRKGAGIGRDRLAPWAQVVASDMEMMAAISGEPNGIGYISYSAAKLGDLSSVKILSIDGYDPLAPGNQYPLSIELGVAYSSGNAEKVKPFLEFITSPEAQRVLIENGLEPIK